MKKKGILFGAIIASLAIGTTAAIVININNNKEIKSLEAEEYNAKTSVQNGLFIKITDENNIVPNEDLLLVGYYDHTLQHIVGASYHYWVTTEYGGVKQSVNGGDYVYCENSKGEMVTMESDGEGHYYLKLKHYVDNTEGYTPKVRSGYIVHEGYNNDGVTAFGDLYIRTKKNKPSANAAKWTLTYENNHMRIESLTGRILEWKQGNNYMWDSFIASTHTEWDSNVDLYRKIDMSQPKEITITKMPDKTVYYYGDKTELDGLEMDIHFKTDDITFHAVYDNNSHKAMFKALDTRFSPSAGCFEWCGIPCEFLATVNHDTRNWRRYLQTDEQYTDLRGTYLLGYVQNCASYYHAQEVMDNTFVLDLSSLDTANPGSVSELWYHQNPVCDGYAEPDAQYDGKFDNVVNNVVSITLESNKFYLKTDNNTKYLGFGQYGYLMKSSTSSYEEDDYAITVDSNNHILINNSTLMLAYDKRTEYEFGDLNVEQVLKMVWVPKNSLQSYHIPVELYRLMITDNLTESESRENFKTLFYSKTAAFDKTGKTRTISASNWSDLATAFNALPLDVKGNLASITYDHYQEERNSLEDMLDCYDSILGIYNGVAGFNDFMQRGLTGNLKNSRAVTLNGNNCSISGDATATYTSSYSATISPNAHFALPGSISILMGGETLRESAYTYNSSTGEVTINAYVIVDDIVIDVTSEAINHTITYAAGLGAGADYVIQNVVEGSSHTLISFATSGFVAPEGRTFKCWKIGGVEYYLDPANDVDITVDDDLIISAVYESTDPVINELEERTATTPFLSYEYGGNAIDGYTFSNVIIRFRSSISKSLWAELDGESSNIQGFGVMFAREDYLSGVELKDLYGDESVDNVNIYNFYSEGLPPEVNGGEVAGIAADSYVWNVRKTVGSSTAKLTRVYVAVTYVKTRDNGVIFLSQGSASVKSLAQSMIASDQYDESSYGGSLNYLANL